MATTTKTRGGEAAPVWDLIRLADRYLSAISSAELNEGELTEAEAEFLAALPEVLPEKVEGVRLVVERLTEEAKTCRDIVAQYKRHIERREDRIGKLRSVLFGILEDVGVDSVRTPSGHSVGISRPERSVYGWVGDPSEAPDELKIDPKPPAVSSAKLAAYVAEVESTGKDRLGVLVRIESAPVAPFLTIR